MRKKAEVTIARRSQEKTAKFVKGENGLPRLELNMPEDERKAFLKKLTGVDDKNLAHDIIKRLAALLGTKETDATSRLNLAIEWLLEMQPRDAVEGMLCSQMIALHDLVTRYQNNGKPKSEEVELATYRINALAKISRLFLEYAEALTKYRNGGSQQTVEVKHVHVNAGGQAIVGNVTRSSRRGRG